jgi:hypothetical protein
MPSLAKRESITPTSVRQTRRAEEEQFSDKA